MTKRIGNRVGFRIGTMFAALVCAGGTALAKPDLVINKTDSKVDFISCEESEPLANGRIVIRNEGEAVANLRSAEDFFRSFVALYVPENIDLIDKDTKRTKLEPREQRTVNVSIGRNKVKTGRNYNALATQASSTGSSGFNPDILDDDPDFAEQIQAFLKSRGYSLTVDGDWGPGSRRALAAFQRNIGLSGNGAWTKATADEIARLSGAVASDVIYSNEKDAQGRTKITVLAVVDPYNLIDESNEMNNVLAYTGYLKCD